MLAMRISVLVSVKICFFDTTNLVVLEEWEVNDMSNKSRITC